MEGWRWRLTCVEVGDVLHTYALVDRRSNSDDLACFLTHPLNISLESPHHHLFSRLLLARSLALVISGSGAFHVIVDRQTLRQTERGTHGERALQPRREDEV